MSITTKLYFSVFISFLIAALLVSIPLPTKLYWFWPQWIVLIMIFWVLYLPNNIGLKTAFVIGLVLDGLSGSMLGEHSLALIMITYLLLKFNNKIIFSKISGQSIIIFALIFLYQGILYWVHGIMKSFPLTSSYWISSITSALVWPYIVMLLQEYVKFYKPR